ncbi:GAF and ANTAR domain-containing protein [Streptomyces alboniger]|uniref:ANTAR domain-containing protein n=1 Tax=Streptomyces alboniger TaxID=132473 RepID=A0A5J6HKW7_STRAD|nr:GAF and ANTAR domain-containing protein [Streptomyces alboniger]QEV20866.1 ANTAR domain-containing protein [Streptomyces alboniger]
MTREEHLLAAVIDAVDTLVDDFDLIDFLHTLCDRCAELLDVSAVGVMLEDPQGNLQLIAASDEHTRLLELFALQHDEGPCVECHRSGTVRLNIDLSSPVETGPFPLFAARAQKAGFVVTHALPMRLREAVIGALNLFDTRPQSLSAADARVAQALADVATIAILQHRTVAYANQQRAQMHAALTSRVTIEQAKGILAERWGTSVDEAFDALRRHARSHQLGLTQLCRQLIDGHLDSNSIAHA